MHAVGSGKLARAMPRVSVDPVMVVFSGQMSGTLNVASEAWNLFWSRSKLACAESVMDSISGVMNTMGRWKMYRGSSLSIAVGEISSKKSVCMTCL